MPPRPPLPFILINRLTGGDDWVTDYPCVSIHCFNASRTLASDTARVMHKQMKDLDPRLPIQMSDGSYVSVDYVFVDEAPHWEFYEDNEIWRYCGRYHIDLRLNQTT